jgi:nucleoside-diphosphate-sugar epimerase
MKVFITGGGGFLGKAIIKQLIEKNHEITSYSRSNYPELDKLGVNHIQGDLNEYEKLVNSVKAHDIVFHVAAKAGIWGDYSDFYNANVIGTENIIKACQEIGIKKLVYTSTPSVIYNGKGIEGDNESLPYPNTFEANYPKTKAIAEKKVLEANSNSLSTVALRPHLIWGPEDHHFLPRLVKKARENKLRLIGNNRYLVDCIYIDNAAKAHILASEKLDINSNISGKAYFITQGKPIYIDELINGILKSANAPIVEKKVSMPVAYFAGTLFENIYSFFNIKSEPPLTKFMVKQLATPHWFDNSASIRDLGFYADISIEEGMSRLKDWVKKVNI